MPQIFVSLIYFCIVTCTNKKILGKGMDMVVDSDIDIDMNMNMNINMKINIKTK